MNKNEQGQSVLPDDTYQILVLQRPNEAVLSDFWTVFELIHTYHTDDWPEDAFWLRHLPFTLLSKFSSFYIEDLGFTYENPHRVVLTVGWEFLSWLDALKERGWEWWSCEVGETTVTLVLLINDLPERLDALLEVLRLFNLQVIRHFVNYYPEREIRHLNWYDYG
ncbi:hypothetical protein LVJ82_09380 [Vitreoscilla massiliensis]|uniref:Uncharacterized protein n=1 Tax=Vitreoscilla massiliensis TaxID=1689272 RepID=A0ABY4E5U1_9NEIS|nr:hypothetical protein [Vitreoscilla massiliensis]UOO91149.1 hypothetical protein LVJ82_09380 [Vitreoscilla massiliensis]